MVDHTNDAWNLANFSDRGQYAVELMNATTFTLETYAELAAEGLPTPKLVMLLGLDNGASEPMAVLNQEIAWYTAHYLDNPKYASQLVTKDGSPLLVVFDGGNKHPSSSVGVAAPGWALVWMASQLQGDPGLAKAGYWSWMDGSLEPVAAAGGNGSQPVALTVTPAFFAGGGWLGAPARGRAGGSVWLQELGFAARVQPEFLVVCQWNEFNGQPNKPGGSYADSYNASLSNDMEPTSLTEAGYGRVDDRYPRGWGFYYLNALRATLDLMTRPTAFTLLAVASPAVNGTLSGAATVSWVSIGAPATTFAVAIDGAVVATVANASSTSVDLSTVEPGVHTISVTAVDATTPYSLSAAHWDAEAPGQRPQASVMVNVVAGAPPSPPSLTSKPVGFAAIPGETEYAYGPTMVLVNDTYHMWYCSPGGNGAWDYIRHTTSVDGKAWSAPDVALSPSNAYDANSVCDPTVVSFNGVWFLYHTCINTGVGAGSQPPDGYTNNRVCVAMADAPTGPFKSLGKPVIEDLACNKDWKAAYCLGQPSAVVSADGSQVLVYVSLVNQGAAPGPNPGVIVGYASGDGVTFSPFAGTPSQPVFSQRDVDVKRHRGTGDLFWVQGDVGSSNLTWSASTDGGRTWMPYDASRRVMTNPSLPSGGSNNNPGLASLPDGSVSDSTFASYGSSYVVGWGKWHLYRTDVSFASAGCQTCAPNSCDFACALVLRQPAHGTCAHPGSTDPGSCCECAPAPHVPDCAACAKAGCVTACQTAGYNVGVCAKPGSTNPSSCCACF